MAADGPGRLLQSVQTAITLKLLRGMTIWSKSLTPSAWLGNYAVGSLLSIGQADIKAEQMQQLLSCWYMCRHADERVVRSAVHHNDTKSRAEVILAMDWHLYEHTLRAFTATLPDQA